MWDRQKCKAYKRVSQGLHHEFDIGGTGPVHWGDGVAMTYPTYHQFWFLLGFRPLYFVESNVNILKVIKLQKIANYWRGLSPYLRIGRICPLRPPVVQPLSNGWEGGHVEPEDVKVGARKPLFR